MSDKVTPHFSWQEASCRDRNKTPVPDEFSGNAFEVAMNIEVLRQAIGGKPLRVNSWYRTPEYNKSIGGAPKSKHLTASAMDISSLDISPKTLYVIAEALINVGVMKEGGLGLYDTFIHYDVRGFRSRWNL